MADGLDAEAGRVGMGSDHADGVAGLPLGAHGEGNDGGAVAGYVVLAARLDGREPTVTLLDALEAGGLEGAGSRGNGMVGWEWESTSIGIWQGPGVVLTGWGGIDKVDEVVGELEMGWRSHGDGTGMGMGCRGSGGGRDRSVKPGHGGGDRPGRVAAEGNEGR